MPRYSIASWADSVTMLTRVVRPPVPARRTSPNPNRSTSVPVALHDCAASTCEQASKLPLGSGTEWRRRALPRDGGRGGSMHRPRQAAAKLRIYFFLLGRCVKADAAAVFAALLDFGFRSTLPAADAALLLVTSPLVFFAMTTSKTWHNT